jgi:transcriptional regulator with XRE-family HTH domain
VTGQELRTLRRRLGWTQQKLAQAVGVHGNSIARQERGEIGISEPLARLIRLLTKLEGDRERDRARPPRRRQR